MIIYSVIFCVSIISLEYFSVFPNTWILLFLVIISNCLKNKLSISTKILAVYSISLLSLIFISLYLYKINHEKWLLSHFFYKPTNIEASIENINNTYLSAKIHNISYKNVKINFEYLNLKISLNKLSNLIQDNSIIKFDAILKPIVLSNNFIDNSLQAKMYYQRIFAKTVNLNLDKLEIVNKKNYPDIFSFNKTIKSKLEHFLNNLNLSHKGIILALLFGDRTRMAESDYSIFQTTGTSHLIAISGMHITLIFYLIYSLSGYAWGIFYLKIYYSLNLNKLNFCILVGWLSAAFYSFISGFSIPTQRAFISISIYSLARLNHINISNLNIFSLCFISVLFLEPLDIFAPGFWLSFVATGFLLYLFSNSYKIELNYNNKINSIKNHIVSNILSCSYMFIALFPITIFYFNKISLYSILANIIAIPVVSLMVLPLLFFTLLLVLFQCLLPDVISNFLINSLLIFSDYILSKISFYLDYIANFDGNLVYYYFNNINFIILSLICLVLLSPRGIPKFIPIISLLILFNLNVLNNHIKNKSYDMILDLLDVGQGLAVLINTPNSQLLYDTGPKQFGDYIAEKIILNTAYSYNKIIDTIIISHWDSDHSGNLEKILQYNKPQYLISSNLDKNAKILETLDGSIKSISCNNNASWQIDDINLRFFKLTNDNSYQGNNSSCILKIQTKFYSVLFTGDIEQRSELSLLQNHGEKLKSDILIVPHHGSKTSSSNNFITQVAPLYALISVANDNNYGHPHEIVVERYSNLGVKLLRTDHNGAIRIKIRQDKIEITQKVT